MRFDPPIEDAELARKVTKQLEEVRQLRESGSSFRVSEMTVDGKEDGSCECGLPLMAVGSVSAPASGEWNFNCNVCGAEHHASEKVLWEGRVFS